MISVSVVSRGKGSRMETEEAIRNASTFIAGGMFAGLALVLKVGWEDYKKKKEEEERFRRKRPGGYS